MTKALLLIDIQNDYFPGGNMELFGSTEAGHQASLLLSHYRQNSLPVIHVQHIALSESATFFLPGTPGVEIHAAVQPGEGETVVVKHYPNAFRETELRELLEGLQVKDLTIAGMMTHMCIDTTVRAASDLGYQVTLVGDACATRDLQFNATKVSAPEVHAAYLAALDGSFAKVVSTASLLG